MASTCAREFNDSDKVDADLVYGDSSEMTLVERFFRFFSKHSVNALS